MNHIEGHWDNQKAHYYQGWLADSPQGHLVIAHGLGEHSGRYVDFAQFLVNHQISVYACDHFGHGKTKGKRGHIETFGDYTKDLQHFIEFVCDKENVETVNLLGHSMGGIIVHDLLWQWTNRLNKVVISNPAYKKRIPPTKIKVVLGQLVGKLLPKLKFNNELDVDGLSTDPHIVEKYVQDPLVHEWVTANWFLTYTDKVEQLLTKTLPNVINPILFISSLSDPLTDQHETEEFYHTLECANSSMIHYDGMYHELLNEVDKEKVYQDVLAFLS